MFKTKVFVPHHDCFFLCDLLMGTCSDTTLVPERFSPLSYTITSSSSG